MQATRTPFDDMPSDDIFAPTREVHPFEARGLGRAPFSCYGCIEGGSSCAYCGTRIKYEFQIKSSDGAHFIVGSECVLKTEAAVSGFKEQRARLQRTLRTRKATALRAQKQAGKDAKRAQFKSEHAAEVEWINAASERGFGFAQAMREAILQWGSLTPGQLGAVQRCATQDKERAETRAVEQAQRAAAAPVVTVERVEQAFAHAMERGIKSPKLRLGEFVLKPAKATGVNPGAIYVTTRLSREQKQAGEEAKYLGKVLGGRFLKIRDCSPEQESEVVAACSDPAAAAVAYGKRTGECAICGRTLDNYASIDRGIGPICAEKYGF